MSSAKTWMAVQYADDGKVLDAAPFGGEQAASRFAFGEGRAKLGWTVRHVAHDGTTLQSVQNEDLPPPEPRKVERRSDTPKRTKGAKADA